MYIKQSRTPDNKPHVERNYGTINTSLLDDLPGKAFSQYLQREGYDSVGEATLTLDEIKEIYLIWLVDIYHTNLIREVPTVRMLHGKEVVKNGSLKSLLELEMSWTLNSLLLITNN